VAEMIAPKKRQSVKEKKAFKELNIFITPYINPLFLFKIFNLTNI
jgi:hypothetical protein